jgi:hypothetical protein
MKRRIVTAALAALAVGGVLSSTRTARAQEIEVTGPLKGAPATRNMRLYREGRLEIDPTISFTLLDEYRRTIFVGARLNYNIKDWIAVGVWGAYGVASITTNLADEIDQTAPRNALTALNVNHSQAPVGGNASFNAQTAQWNYLAALQATFIPFRGKLAIFNKIFVDTDFYAAGGAAIVGWQERGACGLYTCAQPSSFALTSKTSFAPTFGFGFTFYPGNFWSIGVEYRALPFAWNRAGFDCCGAGPNGKFPDYQVNSKDDTYDFNQMITVSAGFFFDVGNGFKTKPRISD